MSGWMSKQIFLILIFLIFKYKSQGNIIYIYCCISFLRETLVSSLQLEEALKSVGQELLHHIISLLKPFKLYVSSCISFSQKREVTLHPEID